jgi:hypothetical protein
MEGSQ